MAASLNLGTVNAPTDFDVRRRSSISQRRCSLSVADWRGPIPAVVLSHSRRRVRIEAAIDGGGNEGSLCFDGAEGEGFTCVMKFDGSSLASAVRIREIANLILSFSLENPAVVLSAMGKTTNHLLLAGEKAVSCGVSNAAEIEELAFMKDLHLRTLEELQVDSSAVSAHLVELEQLLKGIAMMKELTLRTRDYLVSFGVYVHENLRGISQQNRR